VTEVTWGWDGWHKTIDITMQRKRLEARWRFSFVSSRGRMKSVERLVEAEDAYA